MARKAANKAVAAKAAGRTVMFQIRLSREEHILWKAAAKKSALTLSGWARSRLVQLARQETT